MYHAKLIDKSCREIERYRHSTSKVVCVGRNYSAHAKELNNPIPKKPLLFIKSTNTLVDLGGIISIPSEKGECQHELEIAVLIGEPLTNADQQSCCRAIKGLGLGLDLTLRELQSQLKAKGQPWEKSKSFDGACPVSGFIAIDNFPDLANVDFKLVKNDQCAQIGNSKDMLFDIPSLIADISSNFTLYPGDIILTGTPEGVASLASGDRISLELNRLPIAEATIA